MPHKNKPFINERFLAHRKVIGRKIRQVREEKALSLTKASKACGISTPQISLLEKGLVSPRVDTMHLLADGLGKPISFFLPDECLSTAQVTRSNEQKSHVSENATEKVLSNGIPGTRITASRFTVKRGGILALQVDSWTEGVGIVFEGEVELLSEGRKHRLRKGDVFHLRGKDLQLVKNISNCRAELMWIRTASPLL